MDVLLESESKAKKFLEEQAKDQKEPKRELERLTNTPKPAFEIKKKKKKNAKHEKTTKKSSSELPPLQKVEKPPLYKFPTPIFDPKKLPPYTGPPPHLLPHLPKFGCPQVKAAAKKEDLSVQSRVMRLEKRFFADSRDFLRWAVSPEGREYFASLEKRDDTMALIRFDPKKGGEAYYMNGIYDMYQKFKRAPGMMAHLRAGPQVQLSTDGKTNWEFDPSGRIAKPLELPENLIKKPIAIRGNFIKKHMQNVLQEFFDNQDPSINSFEWFLEVMVLFSSNDIL